MSPLALGLLIAGITTLVMLSGMPVAFALGLVSLGFLLMFAVAVWFIVRCIIGLQALGRQEPIRNPESWLI